MLVKEGFVIKQGEKVKGWKKRYLMLHQDRAQLRFEYFKTPNSELIGTFTISQPDQFRVLAPPKSPLPCTTIEFATAFRTYQISAENEEDVKEWVWVIEHLLAHFSSTTPIDTRARADTGLPFKGGWLFKKGAVRRNWKERYFVLGGGLLRYYTSEKCKKALGEIDLSTATSVYKEFVTEGAEQRFMFSIDTPARTYFLAATSITDLDAWLRLLSRCNLTVHNEPSGKYTRFFAAEVDSDDDEELEFRPQQLSELSLGGSSAGLARLGLPFEQLHACFQPPALR